MSKDSKQKKGGETRAAKLTPERRAEIARAAAETRWNGNLPVASHEGAFSLGPASIACVVLPNGSRIITQGTFLKALGRSRSATGGAGVLSDAELPFFLQADILRPFITEDVIQATSPVFYRTQGGGKGVGYDARLLPRVAEVYLRFRDQMLTEKGEVPSRYRHIISSADTLMRALANVGIIALVDEATGYQRDRARDALSRILEEFIAKDLRPWVRTFPDEFYDNIFRLRGMKYPRDTVQKPRYFGHITNDIVYSRLAPGVLDELKKSTPRREDGSLVHHFHRKLTADVGHPKLREHLASVITLMKISKNYKEFWELLNRVHPKLAGLPLFAAQAGGEEEPETGL